MKDFWDSVSRGRPNECWPWTGRLTRDGYGAFGRKRAHRVAYWLNGGEIDGKIIRHRCDNPACCNPNHLIAGTHADNVRDRVERGRSATGSRNGRAKLNAKIVERIYADKRAYSVIARIWGIGWTTVETIKRRKHWAFRD